jgi:geranylgeranyl reductase family protein
VSDHCDVAIIGAGPSGTAAAITLALAGCQVTVIDKATFPRDKICGDGLTTAALRRLDHLGLDPAAVDSWEPVHTVSLRSPSGFETQLPLPQGPGTYAAVARRKDLDNALVERARKVGATVLDGHRLLSISTTSTEVALEVEGHGTLTASAAIAADGMWSPTRKMLGCGIEGYRGDWHAFRQYITNVSPRASRELFVSFEADIVPGYFWSFPLPGNQANIGYGIRSDGKHPLKTMSSMWNDILGRPHIREFLGPNAAPLEPHRAWPIPARVDAMEAAKGRVLFVGDAIAACDVMSGEGIGQALQTGMLAAESLLACRPFGVSAPEMAGEIYSTAVLEALGSDHKMSSLLVRALQHRKGARTAIRIASATPWTRAQFGRWLFEDSPRGIAFEPKQWRRGALSGPGAFRDR